MKRKIEVSPQARRDLSVILQWYRDNLGARAALKVARTIQSRLSAMEAGRVKGAALAPGASRHLRVVARKQVIIFRNHGDVLFVARIVHGAQDMEAVTCELPEDK